MALYEGFFSDYRRRFDEETIGDINRFLKLNGLKYEPVSAIY